MVRLELGHFGEVRIENGMTIMGPVSLNGMIESLMYKFSSPSVGDPDLCVANELVELLGGKIIEHIPAKLPDGAVY